VLELRQKYPLAGLLKLAGLARSTFYYQQKALQQADKHTDLKVKSVSYSSAIRGVTAIAASLPRSGAAGIL
jgi:hypothetical protein